MVPAGNGSAGGRGDDMSQDKDKEILIRYRMDQAHSALKEAVFLREKSDTTLGAVNRSYYAMFYAVRPSPRCYNLLFGRHAELRKSLPHLCRSIRNASFNNRSNPQPASAADRLQSVAGASPFHLMQ